MAGPDEVGIRGSEHASLILQEIVTLVQSLLDKGEGGSIDLSSLSLSERDYETLRQTLGEGEVSAEVISPNLTTVTETGISGVWWVAHFNADEELMAEFIEVAFCPELLVSPQEDVAEGLEGLKARLFEAHLYEIGRRRGG